MENLEKNTQPNNLPERGSIVELVDLAEQEGHQVAEVKVWGCDGVVVPEGEVGVVPTAELNGCHVSIITAEYPDGTKSVSMTHYPPSIGAQRYLDSLNAIRADIADGGGIPRGIVTLVASDRTPRETEALAELFPNITPTELTYKARDKERRQSVDAGRCVAVLDRRDPAHQTLHVATDSGDVLLSA